MFCCWRTIVTIVLDWMDTRAKINSGNFSNVYLLGYKPSSLRIHMVVGNRWRGWRKESVS